MIFAHIETQTIPATGVDRNPYQQLRLLTFRQRRYDSMDTSTLSHPRAVTLIPDPLHRQITLTSFEREIVDSVHFQRLHFILQNSTTYVAYPSNKNTRFSHSLGVAHLCGLLFTNSLRNATSRHLREFLQASGRFVVDIALRGSTIGAGELRDGWKNTISGGSRFRHRPSLRYFDSSDSIESMFLEEKFPNGDDVQLDRQFSSGMLVDTLWEAIRICGLVHDIGHLPMSHSLEGAVKQFRSRIGIVFSSVENIEEEKVKREMFEHISSESSYLEVIREFNSVITAVYPNDSDRRNLEESFRSYPLHEKRSLYILMELYRQGIYKFRDSNSSYRGLLYKIAFTILLSSIQTKRLVADVAGFESNLAITNTAFRFLKLIISGSIDGDRLDYTARDGYACGSDIGRFDIDSIVEHAVMFHEVETGSFKLGFYHRSLPAVEQFFLQRQQSYKYLIYHRTSSRSESCLQLLVRELIEFSYFDPSDPISKKMENSQLIQLKSDKHLFFPLHRANDRDRVAGTDIEYVGERADLIYLDDSVLFSCLREIENIIRRDWLPDRVYSKADKEKNVRLSGIKILLRIVLYREFSHIFDPYKDGGLFRIISQAIDEKVRELNIEPAKADQARSALTQLFAINEIFRKEALKRIRKKVELTLREANIEGVKLVISEQQPKVYSHELAKKKGEEVYIVYNGVRRDSEGVDAREVDKVSVLLSSMGEQFIKEFKVRFFFVAEGVKRNAQVRSTLKATLDAAIVAVATEKFVSAITEPTAASADEKRTNMESEGDRV